MKVIQENHSQMTLRLRPWFLWVFGGIFTSAGLLIALLASVDSFTCRRDSSTPATCELSRIGLLGKEQQILPLEDIQGTKVNHLRDSKGNSSYSLILLTNQGEISPINTSLSNYETVHKWGEEIEVFLQDNQQNNLVIEYDNRWAIYIFSGLFISSGIVVGLCGKVVFCKIDKTLGILTLDKYNLISNSQAEYNIRDIKGLTLQTSTGSKGSKTYRVALVMASGDYIPFTSYYSSGFNQQQQTVDIISKFINLEPIIEHEPMISLPEVFSLVKDMVGLKFMNLQKREAKLATLQEAVRNNPDDAEANYQYGLALSILQKNDEAQPFLATAQRLFSNQGEWQKVQQIDAILNSLNQKS
jgi:tetratricopeptide (TPR) repeat protein